METAKRDFNLKTRDRVLRFIAAGGLENPCFINCKPWENNPRPSSPIMVDAYGFYSGLQIHGYLAFFYQPATDKWIIKSFKRNEEPDSRVLPFRELGERMNQAKEDGGK